MTRPTRMVPGLAAVAAALAAVPASAQYVALNRVGSGARAAGMAHAFVAVSDDGTAASWNPAGLAQLRKPELSLVQATAHRTIEYEGFASAAGDRFTTARDDYELASLDFASLAIPVDLFGKPVTFQLDWRRLYPLSSNADLGGMRFPADGGEPIATELDVLVDGNIDVWSAAAAVRLFPRLYVGLSVGWVRGGWDQRTTWSEPTPDRTSVDFVESRETASMRGWAPTVGLLLSYPAWSVGAVYHAPFDARYERSEALSSNLAPPLAAAVGDARVRLPPSLAVGVAWRPGGSWTVAADATHERWSQALLDRCHVTSPSDVEAECATRAVSFLDGEPAGLSAAQDTLAFNIGAERLFPGDGWVIPLRLGFGYEPQAYRDPIVRDGGEHLMVALGTGYNTNSLKLDAAVQFRRISFGVSERLELRDVIEDGPPAVGTSHVTEWRVKVSLIYRITDTTKLRELVRSVFVD